MDPQKIEVIQYASHPQNAKELLSFLGMENFYQQYIKDFAVRTELLKHLLKRTSNFHWTTKWSQPFDDNSKPHSLEDQCWLPLIEPRSYMFILMH